MPSAKDHATSSTRVPPTKKSDEDETREIEKFPPEEESKLLAEATKIKTVANSLFAASKFEGALEKYEEALGICPNYLDYDVAVLQSNVAACHLKLEQWKDAIRSATAAVDGLARLDAQLALEDDARSKTAGEAAKEVAEVEEEIVSEGATKAAPVLSKYGLDPEAEALRKRKEDVLRIRAKALMRRARARSEEGGWQNLAGAEEDYKVLAQMKNLPPAERKMVQTQLRVLPPRTKAAQEKETAEMWGKLKELGNGILKPFGLSTDNFQMVKDEASGGYSMNFNQNTKK